MTSFPYARFEQNRTLDEARQIFGQRIQDAVDIHQRHHASFVVRDCPFCGSSRFTAVDAFHSTYGVARCDACASLFVNPAPSLAALDDYYNNSPCNRMLDAIYRKRAKSTADPINDSRVRTVLACLDGFDPARRIAILEIGCGSGSFLSKLRRGVEASGRRGVDYMGIDIDGHAVAQNDDPGITLRKCSAEELAEHGEAYDVVLHFELIEHLTDPSRFMQDAHRLLARDGVMIFTTPNVNGLEMIASPYNAPRLLAHGVFPPMHLNAFSTLNVTHFALRHGFAVVDVQTPGALDVDMVAQSKPEIGDELFRAVADLDEDAKGLLQQVIVRCKASSHMQCVLRRSA